MCAPGAGTPAGRTIGIIDLELALLGRAGEDAGRGIAPYCDVSGACVGALELDAIFTFAGAG